MENPRNSSDQKGNGLKVSSKSGHKQSLKKDFLKRYSCAGLAHDICQIAKSNKSIANFSCAILNLKPFKHYKTLHLFIHKKGSELAKIYESTLDACQVKTTHIKSFNLLFQSIKKSKNRSFGQSQLRGDTFEIMGTFISRDFSLDQHNVIIVLSRNDFLPQTLKEKLHFTQFVNILPPFLEQIIGNDLKEKEHKILDKIRELLPIEFHAAKKTKEAIPKYNLSIESDSTDIFHQERINLLGELLNTLRHELSNPLFGMDLSSTILLDEFKDKEDLEVVSEINKSVKRSQSIIENFSTLYSQDQSYTVISLEKFLNEVLTLVKSETRNISKEVIFKRDKGEFSKIKISNPTLLVQVLFNLLINSAQALNGYGTKTPKISIIIELNEGHLCIFIIDNGPGIKNSISSDIFSPFYTTKTDGTGLGLSICKTLMKRLNGTIKLLESGQGCKFLLQIPYENINH